MKHAVESLLVLILVLPLVLCTHAGADMGPLVKLRGGAATPKSPDNTIRLVSQKVTMRLRPFTYLVDAIFHFLNTGASATEWVGFPKRVSYSRGFPGTLDFTRFDMFVNGQKVEVSEERDLTNYGYRLKTLPQDNRWMVHRVTFPSHAGTVIRVVYEAPYLGRLGRSAATYVYGTGTNWKGTIGRATFIIDSSEVGHAKNLDLYFPSAAGPRKISEHLLVSEIRDFEPPLDAELVVVIHH